MWGWLRVQVVHPAVQVRPLGLGWLLRAQFVRGLSAPPLQRVAVVCWLYLTGAPPVATGCCGVVIVSWWLFCSGVGVSPWIVCDGGGGGGRCTCTRELCCGVVWKGGGVCCMKLVVSGSVGSAAAAGGGEGPLLGLGVGVLPVLRPS